MGIISAYHYCNEKPRYKNWRILKMNKILSVEQFKDHFDRGQFTYGDTIPQVRDKDIAAAINEVSLTINLRLFPNEDMNLLAQKLLTAHFLTEDLRAEETKGQAVFNQSNRTVGSISESIAIPDWVMRGQLAIYATTHYGVKWLRISAPFLIGWIHCVTEDITS